MSRSDQTERERNLALPPSMSGPGITSRRGGPDAMIEVITIDLAEGLLGMLDKELQWVRQEDAHGCGIAALSMLVGEPYATVKVEVERCPTMAGDVDWNRTGVSHYTMDRFLISRGYYMQRTYRAWQPTNWPPAPWSPLHYAQVEQPSGNAHFVVMSATGRVLDPARKGDFTLDDWPDVLQVVGLMKPPRVPNHEQRGQS